MNFYGGEPLLAFDLVQKTVALLEERNTEFRKKARYSLTTNGSLLNDERCQFLNRHKFSIALSFDGLAQDAQREKGSFNRTVSVIQKLLNYSSIHLETNSVFTSKTVKLLSESIEFIMELGVPHINCSLSIKELWDQNALLMFDKEMRKLRKILLFHYKRKGNIPVSDFSKDIEKNIFCCGGGKDRFAITPDEQIWGCYLCPDYFIGKEKSAEYKKFTFGTLDNFIQKYDKIYPRILSNYARLCMDNFSTPYMKCFLCSELEMCGVCPFNAGFSGSPLGKIPSYVCEIQKIKMKHIQKFRMDIRKYSPI